MAAAATLKYADLKALLTRGKPLASLVLLLGPEPFFKEEALGLIVAELDRRSGGQLNRVTVDAGSTELDSLPATHLSVSLFGGEKLIVVRNFDKARAADRRGFLTTLAASHLPETIHLLILSEELKASAPELKGCEPLTVTFYVPWQSDFLAWIATQLARQGVRHGRGIPEMLYRMHGKAVPWKSDLEVDLFRLSGSIERLGRHASGGAAQQVDEATVVAVLGRGDPPDVFRLVELIGRRDRSEALRQLRLFLEDAGESPIGLIALLLDRFEKLIRMQSAAASAGAGAWQEVVRRAKAVELAMRADVKRQATSTLSAALASLGPASEAALADIKDFQKPALVLQADKYHSKELLDRFERLVDLDRKLKSGAGDERAEVELFVATV